MTPCGKPFSSLISLTSTWCSDSSELCRAMLRLGPQSCPTPCNSMDCSPPGFSVRGDSPGKFTGVGCHAFLQGIFPTQGLNPGLRYCRWILYPLSHQGTSKNNAVSSLSLLQGNFLTRESNQGLLHCRWILYQLNYLGSPELIIIFPGQPNHTQTPMATSCLSNSHQYP